MHTTTPAHEHTLKPAAKGHAVVNALGPAARGRAAHGGTAAGGGWRQPVQGGLQPGGRAGSTAGPSPYHSRRSSSPGWANCAHDVMEMELTCRSGLAKQCGTIRGAPVQIEPITKVQGFKTLIPELNWCPEQLKRDNGTRIDFGASLGAVRARMSKSAHSPQQVHAEQNSTQEHNCISRTLLKEKLSCTDTSTPSEIQLIHTCPQCPAPAQHGNGECQHTVCCSCLHGPQARCEQQCFEESCEAALMGPSPDLRLRVIHLNSSALHHLSPDERSMN
eukprot:1161525-Pelagomonas_calceolata.AAC.3